MSTPAASADAVCRSADAPASTALRSPTWRASAAVALALTVGVADTALAQTGSELLLRPFRRTDQFEFNADAIYQFDTETENLDAFGQPFNYRADVYDASGRLRLTPGDSQAGLARAEPRAGFQTRYVQIHTGDPALPDELFDGSAAVAMGVLAYDGWLGGLSVGLGYAGTNFEGDANAWYGQASFAIGKTFGNGDTLGFVLDYNGNRTFLPDWPLPGFQYRKRLDPPSRTRPAPAAPGGVQADAEAAGEGYDAEADPARFVAAIGFPFSGFLWRPTDRFRAELTYVIPDTLNLRADYRLLGRDNSDTGLGLYASLSRTNTAVHWNALPRSDRLIFRQSLAEAGVNWRLDDRLELVVSGGWAFGQEFETGWDSRDTETAADIEPGPYARGQVRVRL